ncbi:MAG: thrombospondin type 3 repeat-containing protein [Enhygromyxa sp.]
MKRSVLISTTILLLNAMGVGACVLSDKQIGDDEGAANETDDGDPETGDPETGDGDGDGDPHDPCTAPTPGEDQDCDGVGLVCDNAPDHHNPDQRNQDGDPWGDVADLCPLLATEDNAADSDKDGIGDPCDRCKHPPAHYNDAVVLADDPRMWIRNVPVNSDFDGDGIGDACDNCVIVANCHGYGPDNPAPHGFDPDDGDPQDCQADADKDGIGDACWDAELGGPVNGFYATGPVGFGPHDDFDQDGIANFEDGCPRIPVGHGLEGRITCTSDADCGPGTRCATVPVNEGQRFCNHSDIDNDGVGDICDTCPTSPNPMQITEEGMVLDDPDGDFIGSVCETNAACNVRADPRRIGFYDVSVGGQCCVTTYPGDDELRDPEGVPVRVECSANDEQAGICRKLPNAVAAMPGVVMLPPGCEAALAEAGLAEATPMTLAELGDDPLAVWAHACLLPPGDQDFDGLGDACDLCPFAFDPFNAPYVDEQDMMWPDAGAACNGPYDPQSTPGAMCGPG